MRNWVYILFLIIAISCRKEVEFKIPTGNQLLVVNTNLCTDSFIAIRLSYTQAINDNGALSTENSATIEIFNKDTLLLEKINPSPNGFYITSTTKAQPSTYYLAKITTPKAVYWMNDSCPVKSIGNLIKIDSTIYQGKLNFYRIKFQIKDQQNNTNYYGLKLKHTYENYINGSGGQIDTVLVEEWLDIETNDPLLTQDENNKFSKKHLLFDDTYFNNGMVNFSFGTSAIANTSTRKTKKLTIFLEQYSIAAYQFYATLFEHMFYQNDPFSQPTLVKGNINGAYGSFIGKNMMLKEILFKY